MAVASAAKGWLCVWLFLLAWQTVNTLRFSSHAKITDLLSIYLIWLIATGLVTLAATVVLIVPYVWLRGVETLLQRPWLMYIESGVAAIFASFVLTHFLKPTAETFLRNFIPYLIFALAISLASSAFYLRSVKSMAKQAEMA
ncbi:MAG TPA: hypothetical protein VHW70_08590 [Edaphobacter sp.]|jgi:small-conductance mechanosensitive channel|nr:hypothetical protein [Edaphobacter sp.]